MSEPTAPKYITVKNVKSEDGVVAVITRRVTDGRISWKLVKEYDRNNAVEQTPFMASRHAISLEKMLPLIREALEQAEDEARAAARATR